MSDALINLFVARENVSLPTSYYLGDCKRKFLSGVSISYAPISSKLQHAPGHLTVHRARGGVNLNLALEGWGI